MTDRFTIRMGTTGSFHPPIDHLPSLDVKPTTQDELLVIDRDTYVDLLDRLDSFSYMTEGTPYKHCFEYHGPYILEWKEWKTDTHKLKWEAILRDEIV